MRTKTELLGLDKNFWAILALDHGLTEYKDAVPVSMVKSLLTDCTHSVSSVVMTYGMAKYVSPIENLPIIIQCFGAPAGQPKIQVCDVDNAKRVGAAAVAVQVDFDFAQDVLLQQIKSIAKLVREAHSAELPVLFMIAHREKMSLADLITSIRFCQELGADLIKVRCFLSSFTSDENFQSFKEVLKHSPPVLLAGGQITNKIITELSNSRKFGFSGYCIGRTIFQSPNPIQTTMVLKEEWLK